MTTNALCYEAVLVIEYIHYLSIYSIYPHTSTGQSPCLYIDTALVQYPATKNTLKELKRQKCPFWYFTEFLLCRKLTVLAVKNVHGFIIYPTWLSYITFPYFPVSKTLNNKERTTGVIFCNFFLLFFI